MRLAIKGHPTRGKEVIELLEMLGGKNPYNYRGNYKKYYLISQDNSIYLLDYLPKDVVAYTLEEFEEKYPYKVGDKVISLYGKLGRIRSLIWSERDNQVRYELEADVDSLYFANELQPVEEKETMEEKGTLEQIDLTRELRIADEVEVILGDYEFVLKDGKTYFVKKNKYPKTYEECCQVLMGKTDFQDFELVLTRYTITRSEENSISLCPPHISLINNFYKLLICRDAYWKIAGEQMGLGKPWEPDWTTFEAMPAIFRFRYNIVCDFIKGYHCLLVFPTTEMRDDFYENFKDLVEQCKELL